MTAQQETQSVENREKQRASELASRKDKTS